MKRCLNCMEEYDDSRVRCPGCDYCQGEFKTDPFVMEEGSILQGRYIVGTCKMVRSCDITYIGWDALFDRKVLIQEFFPEDYVERLDQKTICVRTGRGEQYNESLNQFVHYFQSLIRLYKEKDIISVLSCFKENGTAYATMEYSSAATLSEWLKDSPNRDSGDVMYTLYQAVEAVKKVHNLGFIHGDITLDSFWVTATGDLVLKDFAEHYYRCNDVKEGTHREAKPWIDVYGLSTLFGKIVLGQEDVSEKDIRRILESKEYKFPVRTVGAIKKGIAGRGNGINSLDEFYDRIFGDSATMHLVKKKGTEQHGRRLNKKKCALLVGGLVILLCALIAMGAAGSKPKDEDTSPVINIASASNLVQDRVGASQSDDARTMTDESAGTESEDRTPLLVGVTSGLTKRMEAEIGQAVKHVIEVRGAAVSDDIVNDNDGESDNDSGEDLDTDNSDSGSSPNTDNAANGASNDGGSPQTVNNNAGAGSNTGQANNNRRGTGAGTGQNNNSTNTNAGNQKPSGNETNNSGSGSPHGDDASAQPNGAENQGEIPAKTESDGASISDDGSSEAIGNSSTGEQQANDGSSIENALIAGGETPASGPGAADEQAPTRTPDSDDAEVTGPQ